MFTLITYQVLLLITAHFCKTALYGAELLKWGTGPETRIGTKCHVFVWLKTRFCIWANLLVPKCQISFRLAFIGHLFEMLFTAILKGVWS